MAAAISEEELAVLSLAPYVHDPRGFVETQYPWGEGDLEGEEIRDWQGKILDMIGEHLQEEATRHTPLQIAVASGHGIGKSALMAWITQWGVCTFADTIGMITANTDNQLRTKTWREQQTWFNRLGCRKFFKLEGMTLRGRGHEKTWRFDAVNWSDTNTESVQGYHNKGKRLLLLIDEASAVPYVIFEALMGALTDEYTEIIMILFGNPTRPQGFFHDCFTRNRAFWKTLQIDSRDVPGTNKDLFDQWEKQYGADSDFFRVRVRGLFPKSAFDQLIKYETVTEAQEREVAPRLADPLILGCDIARFGDDQNVVYARKGRYAGPIGEGPWKWPGQVDNVMMARRIAKLIRELNPDAVMIDGGGPGGGVIDILREWKYDRETNIYEVSFGAASPNPDYANMRTYMWCEMRDWLIDGGDIPHFDQDLGADLTNVTYQYQEGQKSNAMILTPKQVMKKDGLPSPDFGDALALTFAVPIAPNTAVAAKIARENAERSSETDYVGGWE